MTLWDLLFTNQKSAPPEFGLWYFFLPVSLLVVGYFSIKYAQSKSYQRFWYWAQLIQVLTINAWYILAHMPLTDNLPFYHCRLAMFAVLFLPDRWKSKQFFALMGVSGAIFALGYPVFDPYTFPHITSFSFLLGHYCLLINSLIYLLRWYDRNLLKNSQIVLYTFVLDLFLVGVNQLTGGNYGLMARPPIMRGDKVWLNYLVVSSILALALLLFNQIFSRRSERVKVRK